MRTIRREEYMEAVQHYIGWCPDCEAFTRDCTEPDAEGYDCPVCEGQRVMGAENALIVGEVDFA